MNRVLANVILVCAVFMTFCEVCSAQESWLLQGSDGVWKRFSKQSDWQKAATQGQPLETAVVNQTATSTTVVYDVQGESGDWRNVDRYSFRPDGTLKRLKRIFISLSQDIKLTQTFELEAPGKLTKLHENEVSLKTGKAKKEALENPQLPVASNIGQLEFMKALR